MRYRVRDRQKVLTSFWQGWSVMVVKVLLEQMGWYSLLRVCAAGPCTCAVPLSQTEPATPAFCTLKHQSAEDLDGSGGFFTRPGAVARHLFGDAGDGLPQGRSVPVVWRRHAGCRSVWRRGWDGLLGPAQHHSISADTSNLRSSIQWGLRRALLRCITVGLKVG